MQKDYVLMQKDNCTPVMVSIHSNDYPDYLSSGYNVMYEGNRKDCLKILEGEMELAA